jgi:1-deoxy-D-xylulose-5-phosphate synthase
MAIANLKAINTTLLIIGDASIASGMAFEGLNHAGVTDANLLVISMNNAIGIDLAWAP